MGVINCKPLQKWIEATLNDMISFSLKKKKGKRKKLECFLDPQKETYLVSYLFAK